MRRVWCFLRGHRWVYGNSGALMVIPDRGLVVPWSPAAPGEFGNGRGCTRCGHWQPA